MSRDSLSAQASDPIENVQRNEGDNPEKSCIVTGVGAWGEDEEEFSHSYDSDIGSAVLGRIGEEMAAMTLKRKDYVILERNWKCKAGEADLIALDDKWLVFVEVKTRSGDKYGFPQEAVTARKRARYERIASYYIRDYDGHDAPVRFDVIAVQVFPNGKGFVKHIVNAFGRGD